MIEQTDQLEEKPKRKPRVKKAAPEQNLYISMADEGNEFKIIGIKARRDQRMPGRCVWKVPADRVEAFEINHFFKSGRVVKWTP